MELGECSTYKWCGKCDVWPFLPSSRRCPRGWWSYGVWVFIGIIDLRILRPYTISKPSPSPRDVESATFPTKRKSSFGLNIRTRKGDPIPNRLKSYGFEFGRNEANVPEFGKTQGKLAIFYKKLHRKNSQCQKEGCKMLTHVRLRIACDLPVFSISLRKMIQKPNSQRRFGMRKGFRSLR